MAEIFRQTRNRHRTCD